MKTNPRRIPKTQADCDRAYNLGLDAGIRGALGIVLVTLKDLGEPDAFIAKFNHKFNKTVQSWLDGEIKARDVNEVLKSDYDIEIECK